MKVNQEVLLLSAVALLLAYADGYIPDFESVSLQLNKVSSATSERLDRISDEEYRQAISIGHRSIHHDESLEMRLRLGGIVAEDVSEAYTQYLESKPNKRSKEIEELARSVMRSNSYFVNKHCIPANIDPVECAQYLIKKSLPDNTDVQRKCVEFEDRKEHIYTRLLPARYKDGVYEMLKEPNVPRARRLARSADIPIQADKSQPEYNLLLLQWAQFIEHDLSKPITRTMTNEDPIKCCTSDHRLLPPRSRHPACAPLEGDEPADGISFVSCHNYVRNAQAINGNCTFGPAEMLNQENGKLDLSPLYGISIKSQIRMRTFQDGLLKSSGPSKHKSSFLPFAQYSTEFCVGSNPGDCYMAGDSRVNSNPFSTHLYTIFLRSHNMKARRLKEEKPYFSDEELFKFAQRQNIEEYVAIVYNWWLPIIIGERLATMVKDPRTISLHRSVSSEFGVAAIRFYMSMMPDAVKLNLDCNGSSPQLLELRDHMHNSGFLNRECELNSLLDGMLSSNPHKVDLYYKSIVLKNCFKSKNNNDGINCLALDIQRGRDHGLASYVKYLEVCANTKINDWKSLEPYIADRELTALKSMYPNIDSIDLIVGAMSEKQTNGLLGITFSCIIADEFSKIWNHIPDPPLVTHNRNLAAEFLCKTTGLNAVPVNIFKVVSESNQFVYC